MKIILISDFYLTDEKLIEGIARSLVSLGENVVILIDGRQFAAISQKIESHLLYEKPIVSNKELVEALYKTIYSSILKPFVSIFSNGNCALITVSGEQRGIIQVMDQSVHVNIDRISDLMIPNKSIALATFTTNDQERFYISPIHVLKSLSHQNLYFLTEQLPPDGITTFSDLKIWAESDKKVSPLYRWIEEWAGEEALSFLNLHQLRTLSADSPVLKIGQK